MKREKDIRPREPVIDHSQDFHVGFGCAIEPRSIDEHNSLTIPVVAFDPSSLNLGCDRLECMSCSSSMLASQKIDKLGIFESVCRHVLEEIVRAHIALSGACWAHKARDQSR